MTEEMDAEETFENLLFYFLMWVQVTTLPLVELCKKWGNYNVAWELLHDLRSNGEAIVASTCSHLTADQKKAVTEFLQKLNSVPESLLVSATSADANHKVMSHSWWVPLRSSAALLLKNLDSATTRNAEYFRRN